MFFRKVSPLTTLLLIVVLGCEHTKSVLQPVDTIVPLSPDINQSLIHYWQVTTIDGKPITEGLSQLQTLVAEHVNDEIDISFSGIVTNPIFRCNADGTWELEVYYDLFCERSPILDNDSNFPNIPGLGNIDPNTLSELGIIHPIIIENSSLVFIRLLVGGTYIAGYDTEKQSNVLVFETDMHTEVHIHHENPYSDFNITCIPEDPCDLNFYPAFTADLDWRVFEDEPLSKLFSTPLFDTETDTPVVYTWDMVTSEGTPEDFYLERGWGAGSSFLPEDALLVRRTVRLYSQGQEDINLRRTDERID